MANEMETKPKNINYSKEEFNKLYPGYEKLTNAITFPCLFRYDEDSRCIVITVNLRNMRAVPNMHGITLCAITLCAMEIPPEIQADVAKVLSENILHAFRDKLNGLNK